MEESQMRGVGWEDLIVCSSVMGNERVLMFVEFCWQAYDLKVL